MPILTIGAVDPMILAHVGLGIETIGQQVDLSGLVIRLSTGDVPTAQTDILPDGSLDMVFSVAYERAVTNADQPHPNRPEATAMHEILHEWLNPGNPAFAADTMTVRIGNTNTFQRYFVGPEAMAVAGVPVPIDDKGHLLGNAFLGDIMSGSYPTFRDRPQVLSAIDLAILKDVGAHVWSATEQAVNAAYQVAFNHAPDSAGRAWWTAEIDAGHVDPSHIVSAISGGAIGADADHLPQIVGIIPSS